MMLLKNLRGWKICVSFFKQIPSTLLIWLMIFGLYVRHYRSRLFGTVSICEAVTRFWLCFLPTTYTKFNIRNLSQCKLAVLAHQSSYATNSLREALCFYESNISAKYAQLSHLWLQTEVQDNNMIDSFWISILLQFFIRRYRSRRSSFSKWDCEHM